MSDDIPSASKEEQQQQQPPKNKEDQKAAAALESLNTVTTAISGDQPGAAAPSSSADREALGKAMSRLEISGGQDGKKKATVKVAAEDVGLLVCLYFDCRYPLASNLLGNCTIDTDGLSIGGSVGS